MAEEQKQPGDRKNRPSTRDDKRIGGKRKCPYCQRMHDVAWKATAHTNNRQGAMLRVYLEPSVKQALIDLAAGRGTSLTELVRPVILRFLADNT